MRQKITAVIASKGFFYGILALLVVHAGWIALTARYPQAFDEQFHLGISQLYAQQWSPFFGAQPAGADRLGALQADPSFLYHYLLSFPYRLLSFMTQNFVVQVIVLRFINIGLFVWGLVIFRKLLLKAPALAPVVHVALLVFVLIPVVPLLAAQINYDNLFIPLVGLSLLWATEMVERWRATGDFPLEYAVRLLILCLFAAVVKYPFLPIFAVLLGVVGWVVWRSRQGLMVSCREQLSKLSRRRVVLYGLLLLIAGTLCAGSYGRNVVVYHSPLPACERVLGVQRCLAYSPWARDYGFAHDGNPKPDPHDAWRYTKVWADQLLTELLFSITSRFEADGMTVDYYASPPLPVLESLGRLVFWSAVALGGLFAWRFWRSILFRLTVFVALSYVGVLWLKNYQDYLRTGYPVAVHGRYLVPFLPVLLLAVLVGYGWLLNSRWLRRFVPRMVSQVWLAGVVLFLLLHGGAVTYIVRSDPHWFWGQSDVAWQVTRSAQRMLKPVVIGY